MFISSRRALIFGRFSQLAQPDSDKSPYVEIGSDCMAQAGITCQACAEVCDAEAIAITLMQSGIGLPFVHQDLCTGCGECLNICPVSAISKANQSCKATL